MDQYVIKGGNPLVGEVEIGGAKNAALAIISAADREHWRKSRPVGCPYRKDERIFYP